MTADRSAADPDPGPGVAPLADPSALRLAGWARAVEAGVLARAARDDPRVAWRADATDEELVAVEEEGRRALQELVAANLGLVGAVLATQARGSAAFADLFQEGCLGLIAAVERFDHARGVRFSTYATYWIRTSIASAASRSASAVTIPVSRSDQLRVAHGVQSTLAQELGRLPTLAETAAALGRDERWTARLLGHRSVRSLDELDEHVVQRFAAERPADEVRDREPGAWARRLLAGLEGLEREVLERRLGFGGGAPASLAATARALGLPVGRVRRAEARALDRLRERCPQGALADVAS